MKTQKGFSLLELLLVVAVGAILILAGLAIYRNITNNTQVNEASRLLNVLKQETQRLFQGENSYGAAGSDLTNILVNAEAAPQRSINSAGDDIVSPFDEDVSVIAQDDDFQIIFANVTEAACLSLGVAYTNDDNDFSQVTIGSTSLGPDSGNVVSVVSVDDACIDGDVTTMTWTFE